LNKAKPYPALGLFLTVYALVTTIESTQNIFASALDYFWKMPVMYNRNFKPKTFADVTMLAK
jgi:hypothetical protein